MADNIEVASGSGGPTIAADDVGGIHYPRSKVSWGIDGAAVDASASNPLPVTVSEVTSAFDNAGDTPGGTPLAVPVLSERLDTLATNSHSAGAWSQLFSSSRGALWVELDTATVDPTTAASWGLYAEDAGHSSGATGSFVLGVRNDSNAALAGTTGDYSPFQMNSFGRLRVEVDGFETDQVASGHTSNIPKGLPVMFRDTADSDKLKVPSPVKGLPVEIIAGGGSGGTAMGDDGAFTIGTSSFTPIGGVYDDTTPSTVGTEHDGAAARITQYKALHVNLRDASGTEITSFGGGTQYGEGTTQASITGTAMLWEDASNVVRVPSATNPFPVNIVSGGGSGGTAMADDGAFTAGTTSVTPIAGFYDDTAPTAVGTEHDVAAVRITQQRGLHVNIRDNSGSEVTNFGSTQYTAATDTYASSKLGTSALAVRNDTSAILAGVLDGEYTPLQTDSAGSLRVHIQSGSSSGTEFTDGDLWTQGASGTLMLGVMESSSGSLHANITDGDYSPFKINANGRLEVIGDIPAYAYNAVPPATPTGPTIMVVRDDALSTITPAAGDWTHPLCNSRGALWVKNDDFADNSTFTEGTSGISVLGGFYDEAAVDPTSGQAAAARITVERGLHVNLRNSSGTEIGDSTTPIEVNIDGFTSGAPILAENAEASGGGALGMYVIPARRKDEADLTTVSADDDYADLQVDEGGALRVTPAGAITTSASNYTATAATTMTGAHIAATITLTATTTATDIVAAATGRSIAITSITAVNSDGSTATTLELQDNTTKRFETYLTSAGGGITHNGGNYPILVSGSGSPVKAKCGSSVSSVYVSVAGYLV